MAQALGPASQEREYRVLARDRSRQTDSRDRRPGLRSGHDFLENRRSLRSVNARRPGMGWPPSRTISKWRRQRWPEALEQVVTLRVPSRPFSPEAFENIAAGKKGALVLSKTRERPTASMRLARAPRRTRPAKPLTADGPTVSWASKAGEPPRKGKREGTGSKALALGRRSSAPSQQTLSFGRAASLRAD